MRLSLSLPLGLRAPPLPRLFLGPAPRSFRSRARRGVPSSGREIHRALLRDAGTLLHARKVIAAGILRRNASRDSSSSPPRRRETRGENGRFDRARSRELAGARLLIERRLSRLYSRIEVHRVGLRLRGETRALKCDYRVNHANSDMIDFAVLFFNRSNQISLMATMKHLRQLFLDRTVSPPFDR